MKKQLWSYVRLMILVMGVLYFCASCSKVVDVDIPDSAQKIVVEGTIENGVPPIIILTQSQKFFGNVDVNNLGKYFVRGARVIVKSPTDSVQLVEYCLKDLPLNETDKQLVLASLGFSRVDSATIPDVCVYTVPDIITYFTGGTTSFAGKEQTKYDLWISGEVNGKQETVTASTYIPKALGLDSLGAKPHPNPAYRDSMAPIYAYFTVPDTFGNFVRYWTKRNSEQFYKPLSSSVYDDKLFIGLSVGLPLERGQPDTGSAFNPNTYTYFYLGDTVTVKWSNISATTYNFFYTLESDGGGPFSSPVKIKSNIDNGFGIWAGYASKYYTKILPK